MMETQKERWKEPRLPGSSGSRIIFIGGGGGGEDRSEAQVSKPGGAP